MTSISDIALVTQVAVFHNKQAFDQLVRKSLATTWRRRPLSRPT